MMQVCSRIIFTCKTVTITVYWAQAALVFNPIEDLLITSIKGEGALYENRKIRNRSMSQEKLLYVIDDKKINYNI